MIVSYNWLKELINLNVSPEKLAEEMSLYSVEVETFNKMVKATNLVVGHVLECVDHPNSDHLHVCQVNLGEKIDQIVDIGDCWSSYLIITCSISRLSF